MKLCNIHVKGKIAARSLYSKNHLCNVCGTMAKWVIRIEDQHKLCTTCGERGDCDGTVDKCANCWEVERRLPDYLQSEKGRQRVLDTYALVIRKEYNHHALKNAGLL